MKHEIIIFETKELNAVELDLFIAILFLLKNKKSEEISLTFSQLKKLAEIKGNHTNRLINNLKSMNEKLLNMTQKIILPNDVIKIFNLFENIIINPNEKKMTISLNKENLYLIDNFVDNYTKIDLKNLIKLSSKYSKQLFILFKQSENNSNNSSKLFFKNQEKVKNILGIPEGYDRSHYSKLLTKLTKDIEPYFKNLKLEKLNKNKERIKKGQKTEYLKWTWEVEEIKFNETKDNLIDILKSNLINRIIKKCGSINQSKNYLRVISSFSTLEELENYEELLIQEKII